MRTRKLIGLAVTLVLVLTTLAGTAFAQAANPEFFYYTTKQTPNLYIFGDPTTPLYENGGSMFYIASMTLVIGTERCALIDRDMAQALW
jgi:hypothetical protein